MANEPKKGTGKKPKGSSRRLYTDENPKDTVSVKFSSRQDIVDTLNKASFKSKSHARQSQIINLIHQRVRAAYGRAKDPAVKKRLKTALDYAEQRKEASKRKTQSMKKENIDPKSQAKHKGKSAPYGSAYELVKELVLQELQLVKELKCKYGTYFCNHDKVYKCRLLARDQGLPSRPRAQGGQGVAGQVFGFGCPRGFEPTVCGAVASRGAAAGRPLAGTE